MSADATSHRIERVRHPLRVRHLTVKGTQRLTPHMIRITLSGPELEGFHSAANDDHVKLFFPRETDGVLIVPTVTEDGRVAFAEGERPIARDYTPRSYDAEKAELVIDFAVHEAGPATSWALQAAPGQVIGVAGPRGSFVVSNDFDWYLLAGDETALPAISRRLEELPEQSSVIVLIEVQGQEDEQPLTAKAHVACHWLHRGNAVAGETTLLDAAAREISLPEGEGYIWVACESDTAKRLRSIFIEQHRHPKQWIKASGYWQRGSSNIHTTHED